VQHSAPHSVHGGMTPQESIIIDVQDTENIGGGLQLQLTEEQLQQLQQLQLQQLQQQMMQDLEGEDGEMM
jgi:hypothetical protein